MKVSYFLFNLLFSELFKLKSSSHPTPQKSLKYDVFPFSILSTFKLPTVNSRFPQGGIFDQYQQYRLV
jgi:hypothetical protein